MSILLLDAATLRATVDKVLPQIPSGHDNAIIATADAAGAQILVTARLGAGGNWTAMGVLKHAWTGEDSAGASLMYSWKRAERPAPTFR